MSLGNSGVAAEVKPQHSGGLEHSHADTLAHVRLSDIREVFLPSVENRREGRAENANKVETSAERDVFCVCVCCFSCSA